MTTTNAQHTPGPIERAYVSGGDVLVPCSGVVQATNVLPLVRSTRDLLAALEQIDGAVVEGDMRSLVFTLKKVARAALRKARGEEG